MIWGCAFSAQSAAAGAIGPWLFNGIRFLMGGLELILLSKALHGFLPAAKSDDPSSLWKASVSCGLILILASVLQQAGIRYTTAGKAGFITSLYVVLVPLAEVVFFRRRPGLRLWAAVGLAVTALFLLSGAEKGRAEIGDVLMLGCAFAFAGHILLIDRAVKQIDPIRFSALQFLTAGMIGMIGAVLFEEIRLSMIKEALIPLLYTGLLSAGLGYTLQVIGQADTEPAAASLLLSLESVFSVLFGFLLLGEVLSARELIGCGLLFAAVMLVQIK